MTWPRWLAHLRAEMFGWFWMPCPGCGRMFAGFEKNGGMMDVIQIGTGKRLRSMVMCPRCPEDRRLVTLEGWYLRDAYWTTTLSPD